MDGMLVRVNCSPDLKKARRPCRWVERSAKTATFAIEIKLFVMVLPLEMDDS